LPPASIIRELGAIDGEDALPVVGDADGEDAFGLGTVPRPLPPFAGGPALGGGIGGGPSGGGPSESSSSDVSEPGPATG
jgi:hypothetical protein